MTTHAPSTTISPAHQVAYASTFEITKRERAQNIANIITRYPDDSAIKDEGLRDAVQIKF